MLGLLLAPLASYPLFAGSLFLCDLLFGDRELVYFLRYDRRRLWDTFWADYLHALPTFYLGAAGLVLLYLAVRRVSPLKSPLWLVGLALVAGAGFGGFLRGRWLDPAALWVGLPMALAAVPIAFFVSAILSRRSVRQ